MPAATVRELIAHLQTMPQNAPVLYRASSDWQGLELREVSVVDYFDKFRAVYIPSEDRYMQLSAVYVPPGKRNEAAPFEANLAYLRERDPNTRVLDEFVGFPGN